MPRVTVITGYYNRAHALEHTIMSVLNQTFADFEFIVFDDASTDDTEPRLREIEERVADPRLKVKIHRKNTGFVKGLIDAIEETDSDLIAIVGSGDICSSRRLQLQVDLLDARQNVAAVGCHMITIVEGSNFYWLKKPNADKTTLEGLRQGNVFGHGEVTYRRSAYALAGGYRAAFKFSQDYDLWLRMIRFADLATVPEPLYFRFARQDGASYAPAKFLQQARYALIARMLSELPDDEAADLYRRLEREGPTPLVPQSDSRLQARILKTVLKSIAFGETQSAREICRAGVSNPLISAGLVGMSNLVSVPIFQPVAKLLSRQAGLKSFSGDVGELIESFS